MRREIGWYLGPELIVGTHDPQTIPIVGEFCADRPGAPSNRPNILSGRQMAMDLELIEHSLSESKVLSSADISRVRSNLDSTPQSAEEFVQELIQQELLTPFQAKRVLAGELGSLKVGEYVLVDEIGCGGMGQVYVARHCAMDRIVAIKLVGSNSTDPTTARRFEREVLAAARLQHPNIVTAYDAFLGAGKSFLVMEYVDGKNLEEAVRVDGLMTVECALDILAQAAAGLQYAHEQGVYHRDIKPANLLIDARGTVRLLDMGLARLDTATNDEEIAGTAIDHGLTRSGQIMGTVDYMSPEQATNTRSADQRSDIYSLGGVLHFLLTGHPLFRSESVVNVLMALANRPPPALSDSRDDIPAAVEAIYGRMVAKDPADRYQNAEEVLADLAQYRDKSQAETRRNIHSPTNVSVRPELAPALRPAISGWYKSKRLGLPIIGVVVFFAMAYFVSGFSTSNDGETSPSQSTKRLLPAEPSTLDIARRVSGRSAQSWVTFSVDEHSVQITKPSQVDAFSDDVVLTGVGFQNVAGWTRDDLEYLRYLSGLSTLSAYGTPIDDKDIPLLLENSTIVNLHLEKTAITDSGLALLAKANWLEDVSFGQNDRITDQGLRHLGKIKSLQRISVRQTKVSDVGLKSLYGLTNLVYLNTSDTDVTEQGARAFRQRMPNCQLIFTAP